jgi:hypothetical protein
MRNATILVWLMIDIAFSGAAFAEVKTGTGEMIHPSGMPMWDFSAERCVGYPNGDIGFIHELDLGFIVAPINGAAVQVVSGIAFEDVLEAPEDPSSYEDWVSIDVMDLSTVYVVRTEEGHFAKFRFLDSTFGSIQYAYQDDGSRVLDPGTPVHEMTWGEIKWSWSYSPPIR